VYELISRTGQSASHWGGTGFLAGAAAATIVFFHRAVFSGRTFIGRDMLRVYFPLYRYWAERVRNGGFPEWYPFDGLGQPFVGAVVSGAFHPIHLIWLLAPPALAMNISVLVCFPVSLCGVFYLSRSLSIGRYAAAFAAITYAFSGYAICITNNFAYLLAVATVPWVLWAVDRVLTGPSIWRVGQASAFLALLVLGGDLEAFAISCAMCVPLAFYRCTERKDVRKGAWVAAIWGFGTLLSAIQVLPAFAVRSASRNATLGVQEAMLWSVHPLRVLDLGLGPIFAAEPGTEIAKSINRELLSTGMSTLWVDSLYIGLLPLVFALVALLTHRRARGGVVLLCSIALLIVLALGKHGLLYPLAIRALPLLRSFRYPEKIMPWVGLAIALSAAVGLQTIESHARVRRWTVLALLGLGLACTSLGLFQTWNRTFLPNLFRGVWHLAPPAALEFVGARLRSTLLRTGIVLSLLALFLRILRTVSARSGAAIAAGFLLSYLSNEPMYQLARPAIASEPSPLARRIIELDGPPSIGNGRVYRLTGRYGRSESLPVDPAERFAEAQAASLEAVIPGLWGLEGSNDYLPAVSSRVDDLADEFGAFATLSGIFTTRYVIASQPDLAKLPSSWERVGEDSRYQLVLLRNNGALPRAYLALPHCVDNPRASARLLRHPQFSPHREVLLECDSHLVTPATGSPGQVFIRRYLPEEVLIDVENERESILVVTDAYYDGWVATIDGAKVAIMPANHSVRAVTVPPGRHEVTFRYHATGLRLGAGISLLSLLVMIGCAGMASWSRSRSVKTV